VRERESERERVCERKNGRAGPEGTRTARYAAPRAFKRFKRLWGTDEPIERES